MRQRATGAAQRSRSRTPDETVKRRRLRPGMIHTVAVAQVLVLVFLLLSVWIASKACGL